MYQTLNTFTDGKITSNSVMKLSVEQLKSLVMLIDGDPANTEEYEHAVFSPDEIRYDSRGDEVVIVYIYLLFVYMVVCCLLFVYFIVFT